MTQAAKENPYYNPRSLSYRFRQNRYKRLRVLIDQILARKGRCRVLDIGGSELYWDIGSDQIQDERIQIDVINLELYEAARPNFRHLIKDACDLHEFDDMSYDLVHSNSVIEHVGAWGAMQKMAANVRRLAPVYFVQTPYFWFPIEPHFQAPFFHWLPEQWRYRLMMSTDLGFVWKASSVSDAVLKVQHAALIDYRQFEALFPDAEIVRERVLGLTKSLIAIRAGH